MTNKAQQSTTKLPHELPDDFFDSHKRSKKSQDDDLAKEMEQFDREMAALEAESEEQLNEEFEKLQEEKNIDELDQQLEQWKRIVDLEKRAEELQSKTTSEKPSKKMRIDGINIGGKSVDLREPNQRDLIDEPEGNLSDIEDFEDKLFNWRSKGL